MQALYKDVKLLFDDSCLKSFKCLKEQLISEPIIVSLDWFAPLEVMYDASGVALGTLFCQRRENIIYPIYYARKI